MRGTPLSEVASDELLAEWDYDKNGDLTPSDIAGYSRKKVWWKCSEGHSWQSAIYNRMNGVNCPYCANKKVLVGFNDLATINPDIAVEWDYEKNGSLKPTDVTSGSSKKVWWICSKGHSYDAFVKSRVSRGQNCPYCSGQRVLIGFNDLAITNPDIVVDWDFEKNGDLEPTDVTSGSGKKVWWMCSKGHSWQARIYSRIGQKSGCPYCSGEKAIPGGTDLATTHPELAVQLVDQNLATQIRAGSNKKVEWQCEEGHRWITTPYKRTLGQNCPYCSGQRVLVGFNDLATTHSDIAAEWDYEKNGSLKPTDVTSGSGKKVWWICSKGHSYQSSMHNRIKGKGCPFCVNKKVLVGFNDLVTTYPDIAVEWDYKKNGDLKPTNVTFGSHKKVWWMCSKGHSYCTSISHRTVDRSDCPVCNISRGEKFVERYAKHCCVFLKSQWWHFECFYKKVLPFDFAIFSDELSEMPIACIEYQGEQHYHPVDVFGGKRAFKSQQKRDTIKREFCEQSGIPLILIPFSFNTQELVNEILDACFKELGIR